MYYQSWCAKRINKIFTYVSDEGRELGNAWEKSGEFEGDILIGADDSIRNGLISDTFYWPNKTLVYKLDTDTFG